MVRIVLEKFGHEVTVAGTGREALRLFHEDACDLLLTDIVMPDKEGLEVIGKLRPEHPWLKIVAMSGGGRGSATDYLKLAKQLGADAVLEKPFSTDRLL